MEQSRSQRIQRCLQELADWRCSGLTLKDYAQRLGQVPKVWRARQKYLNFCVEAHRVKSRNPALLIRVTVPLLKLKQLTQV